MVQTYPRRRGRRCRPPWGTTTSRLHSMHCIAQKKDIALHPRNFATSVWHKLLDILLHQLWHSNPGAPTPPAPSKRMAKQLVKTRRIRTPLRPKLDRMKRRHQVMLMSLFVLDRGRSVKRFSLHIAGLRRLKDLWAGNVVAGWNGWLSAEGVLKLKDSI